MVLAITSVGTYVCMHVCMYVCMYTMDPCCKTTSDQRRIRFWVEFGLVW
jgi:hypothetical protein